MCIDRKKDGRTDRHDEGKRRFATMWIATIKGIRGLTLDLVLCNSFQETDIRLFLLLDSD